MVLENKRVIVTGGLRGIGKAIVRKCLEEGAIVCTTYCNSGKNVEDFLHEFKEYKDRIHVYKMDVTNSGEVADVMDKMMDSMNGIDVLVNNAGITKDNLLFRMTDEEWDEVIKTNLYGTFYTTKRVIISMVAQKRGSIVNVSSISGLHGAVGQANYCASKFGVIGLTKTAAKEYAHKNVRVNAVAPGFIETDMVKKMNKKVDDILPKKGGMNRIGQVEEVAEAVVFLASDKSSYITGEVIKIDGGIM